VAKGTCPARSGQRCNRPRFSAPGLLKMLAADGHVLFNPFLVGSWGRSQPAPWLQGDEHQAGTEIQKGNCGASLTDTHMVFLAVNEI